MNEQITKAAQCAALLVDDLRDAHTKAVDTNPVLAILLKEFLSEAHALKFRLGELEVCLK